MIQLSNRTFPMLQVFASAGSDYHMRIEEAQTFDQRPFRALLMHKWIAYRPGRGFHITKEGRKAWDQFEHTSIERQNPRRPLTAYFDPTAYGPRPMKRSTETVREALNRTA